MKVKYIKTDQDEIVVFRHTIEHSEFKKWNPVSAGFIAFGADGKSDPTCNCYGESISLKLKSDPEVDSALARDQILGFGYF